MCRLQGTGRVHADWVEKIREKVTLARFRCLFSQPLVALPLGFEQVTGIAKDGLMIKWKKEKKAEVCFLHITHNPVSR